MSIEGILFYSIRALIFALGLLLVYGIIQKIRGKKISIPVVLSILYLGALMDITVIRSGINLVDSRGNWQLEPLIWTIYQLRGGLWTFLYPSLGNILWFVPMGIILGRKFKLFKTILLTGLISFSIESLQWIFNNGISDIDDIIFNITGAFVGYLLYYLIIKKKKARL